MAWRQLSPSMPDILGPKVGLHTHTPHLQRCACQAPATGARTNTCTRKNSHIHPLHLPLTSCSFSASSPSPSPSTSAACASSPPPPCFRRLPAHQPAAAQGACAHTSARVATCVMRGACKTIRSVAHSMLRLKLQGAWAVRAMSAHAYALSRALHRAQPWQARGAQSPALQGRRAAQPCYDQVNSTEAARRRRPGLPPCGAASSST